MSGLETKNYFTHNASNAPLKTLLATGGADVQLRHLELGSHTALLCSRCWSSREVAYAVPLLRKVTVVCILNQ